MSERVDQPEMHIKFEEGEFTATPENAELSLYIGSIASRDHIFLLTGEVTEDSKSGTFIFSAAPTYQVMKNYMMQNGYPIHANLRQTDPGTEEAYDRLIGQIAEQELGNIDDEWSKLLDGNDT